MFTHLIDPMDDLDQWLGELDALGIDTTTRLAPVYDAKARVGVLASYRARFSTEPRLHDVGVRLAADPGEYDTAVAAILTASIAASEGVADKVGLAFDEAESVAAQEALNAFRAARGALIAELGKLLDGVLATVSSNSLPAGVMTLEAATRSGVGDHWLALERAHATYHQIASLLASWRARHLTDRALSFRHPEKLADVPRSTRARGAWLALAIKAGAEPAILTASEADAISDRAAEGTPAWAHQDAETRAKEEEAEAERNFLHPKPERRTLPGTTALAR